MTDKNRLFTTSELTTARAMLTLLAHESASYWANALSSSSFMNEGTVEYRTSSSYKADHWVDCPNPKATPVTGEQIIKFQNAFMEDSRKTIEEWLKRDTDVALILYNLKDRILGNGLLGMNDSYTFGGWDNDPFGEVAYSMRVAGIYGAMSVNSPFQKTCLCIREGTIYVNRFGGWKTPMMDVYKP